MKGIFYKCSLLESLPDISRWNSSNVTNIVCIFRDCSLLRFLPDLSKWNTENITNMRTVFSIAYLWYPYLIYQNGTQVK